LAKLESGGNRIQAESGDGGRIRWGWAPDGLLAHAPLTHPQVAAPTTLNRQFLRVCAVDTEWCLLVNRTGSPTLGVPKDDERIQKELLPEVRDQVTIDYLVDGPDTLAEATRVLQLNTPMTLVVSPVLDDTLITPNLRGVPAHWLTFPTAQAGPPGGAIPTAIPRAVSRPRSCRPTTRCPATSS
jgi:hypothetical protein